MFLREDAHALGMETLHYSSLEHELRNCRTQSQLSNEAECNEEEVHITSKAMSAMGRFPLHIYIIEEYFRLLICSEQLNVGASLSLQVSILELQHFLSQTQ